MHFLPLRELTERCPMARCDGMHFGSDYASFGCHATMAVSTGSRTNAATCLAPLGMLC